MADEQVTYDTEKALLVSLEQEIKKKITEEKDGKLIRCFGASQLHTTGGERPIGVVVVRSLSARNTQVSKRNFNGQSEDMTIGREENTSELLYEVWGFYDPKDPTKVGLLVSFRPEMIACVVNLRSGLDTPTG